MRVLVKSTSRHELILDDTGMDSSGALYETIPDVLNDDTADVYEKTRTIIEVMKGNCPDSSTTDYEVWVFDSSGTLTMSGAI